MEAGLPRGIMEVGPQATRSVFVYDSDENIYNPVKGLSRKHLKSLLSSGNLLPQPDPRRFASRHRSDCLGYPDLSIDLRLWLYAP